MFDDLARSCNNILGSFYKNAAVNTSEILASRYFYVLFDTFA
jgi:hypothetical protein